MAEILYKKRERKNDTVWEYRFEIASVDGKRKWISKSGFKTKTEAKEAGKQALKLYENTGVAVKPTDMSFSDFLDYWIEHRCRLVCKEGTVVGYEKKIRLYIKPELGSYRLRSITKGNIQKLITDMYNKGFSLNTITSVKGILSKCFEFAIDDDNKYLSVNPCDKVIIPKPTTVPETPTRTAPHIYLTQDMIKKIFERFPEGQPTHIPLMLGYRCGLRLGETFGIVWEDIDFEKRTLSINRQVQWHSFKSVGRGGNRRSDEEYGYWYFSEPKYRSYRTITLDDDIFNLLVREKERHEKAEEFYGKYGYYTKYYAKDPLLFGGNVPTVPASNHNQISNDQSENELRFVCRRDDGTYITPRTLQHTANVIHKQLEIADYDYHSFRHTHATMLAENGAPPIYTMKRLGHKNIETTLGIYANHMTESFKDQGNNVLNNMF